MLQAIDKIEELSENCTQHSGNQSKKLSAPSPCLVEVSWSRNPLADSVAKSELNKSRSEALQIQADKYRSGDTRKVRY